MMPYTNDTDFAAKHEHYRDMLASAESQIALRRGELPRQRRLPAWVANLAIHLPAWLRRLRQVAAVPAEPLAIPCPDPEPCN